MSSRLNYAKWIIYSMSKSLTNKLQRHANAKLQQNTLAQVILWINRLSSAEPLLSELHWLPVASRIQFKIVTLTHKILQQAHHPICPLCWTTTSPLDSFVRPVQISSSSYLLVQPHSKTKFGSLAFHTAAPLIWNGLPADARSSLSFQTCKKMLKTYYFDSPPT